jgi:hypothetical protein
MTSLPDKNAEEILQYTHEPMHFFDMGERPFIEFLRHLWNLQKTGPEGIWEMIAQQEAIRTFHEGHNFCPSHLSMESGPNTGKRWWYITTSGTLLQAVQYGENNSKLHCAVALPESRLDGYTRGILDLYLNNPELKFFSDWEMKQSQPGTEEYNAAKIRGFIPLCEKIWEEMSSHEKRTADSDRYQEEKVALKASQPHEEDDGEEYEYDENEEYEYEYGEE